MKTITLLPLFLLLSILSVYSQAPPSTDPNWILNTTLSDEFSVNTFSNSYMSSNAPDPSKWHALDVQNDPMMITWGGADGFKGDNAYVSGGELILRTDNSVVTPNAWNVTGYTLYKTGGVLSYTNNYPYGYFEMRALLPGFTSTVSGLPVGDKFWPSFWTFWHTQSSTCTITAHKEIDILEPSGSQYGGVNNVSGYWSDDGACAMSKLYEATVTASPPNAYYQTYHKFGAEWGTNRLIFYLDDVPYQAIYNDPALISNFLEYLVMDSQLDKFVNFNSETPFPQYYKVDYFRYYQLNKDCSNSVSLYSNSDITNFFVAPAIKSYINIGSGSISLSSGDVRIFRFVNDCTIYGDFTVPTGAELDLLPTPCD